MDMELPFWNLEPIFLSPDDALFKKARKDFHEEILQFREKIGSAKTREDFIDLLVRQDRLLDLQEELGSYLYCLFSTDTKDILVLKQLNSLEEDSTSLHAARSEFREYFAALTRENGAPFWENLPEAGGHLYFLRRELERQKHQMSVAEEALAAELGRTGADAWSRLQEAISSQLGADWEEEGKTGRKTIIELRGLASHPQRQVRQKAFQKELELWKQMETPLAYALNGVKGVSLSLSQKRAYSDPLEASLFAARIRRETLDALITEMRESLPVFQRYWKAKAEFLGLERLSFYDLFAPVGGKQTEWDFGRAAEFIIDKFTAFSDEMGAFARHAFENRWIDAKPREGKVGGAYCTSFPLSKESRVLCNFDGSFDGVSTIAHELGHAYHHEVLKDAGTPARRYPMTLAETASIFAERIIFDQACKNAAGEERLFLLETFLQSAAQVIVDILSRYLFESRVFVKRKDGELSPEEFSRLMLDAQKECYGQALNEEELHPYMWAVKGHYYMPNLDFYNFPYAFGQLFGLGLYARYEETGPGFYREYKTLLAATGLKDAEDLCAQAGFDITSRDFWRSGIAVIERHVCEFENLRGDIQK